MNVFATSAQAANFGGSIGLFGATDNAATVFASFAAIQGVKSNSTAGNTGGELRLFTRTAGGPMSERMRIDASGNVGIGTASPAVKLDVTASGGDIAAFRRTDAGNALVQYTNANTTDDIIHRFRLNAGAGNFYDMRYYGTGGYFGLQYNGNNGLHLTTSSEVLINTTFDAGDYKLQLAGNIYASGLAKINDLIINGNSPFVTGANVYTNGQSLAIGTQGANLMLFFTNNTQRGFINSAGEWIIDASGTDAGDYKLQVVGNARIGTGKLDISSNTAFSMNVQRSGTSEVAGTFNNSNAILYLGAESSTGGSLFTGSSAYAAVIGSGAAYPLQFATNNVVRATINADGEMLIGGTDVGLYNLQVTGNAYTQTFQYVGNVLGINTGTYNSAGTAQITMKNGTNPDGSVTDQFILYSADVVAGNAAPHFRTENGGIIKLYQETTAVGAATFTANSGTAVNDASTFDGYTLKQIVKALRNQGILQ
jgi:hypothetical protein